MSDPPPLSFLAPLLGCVWYTLGRTGSAGWRSPLAKDDRLQAAGRRKGNCANSLRVIQTPILTSSTLPPSIGEHTPQTTNPLPLLGPVTKSLVTAEQGRLGQNFISPYVLAY